MKSPGTFKVGETWERKIDKLRYVVHQCRNYKYLHKPACEVCELQTCLVPKISLGLEIAYCGLTYLESAIRQVPKEELLIENY